MKATPSRTALDRVLSYHERTKHHLDRFARSLGYMDWDTQPDPFRRYEGADLLPLDEVPPAPEPAFESCFRPGAAAPHPVDRAGLSQLFYDSLAISAWKEAGSGRWSLRVNPSSGNLHPTEGYLLAGAIPGLSDTPALYHYSPFHHALEIRSRLSDGDWSELSRGLPAGTLLLGLTSIHWRESWKYGERAFRYCHHDAGHAIAAVAMAAAVLGWRTDLLEAITGPELSVLLGVAGSSGVEAEHPDGLLAITPADGTLPPERLRRFRLPRALRDRLSRLPLSGTPNRLSPAHQPWPVIEAVAAASERLEPPPEAYWETRPEPPLASLPDAAAPDPGGSEPVPARAIIRRRRSAVMMDGRTGLDRDTFFGMLEMLLPRPGRAPFAALPWKPAVHLLLFAHRVDRLEPGLYALVREPGATAGLKSAMHPEFEWSRPAGCPDRLPLFRLLGGDVRDTARMVSCRQEIAADGAFALAMIAEFEPPLQEWGGWFYRRLHWEAGAVGQVLYLGAEAAGIRGTGIGCFFDDALHRVAGLTGRRYQDLYHFTVGGPLHDPRLRTLPAYHHRKNPPSE